MPLPAQLRSIVIAFAAGTVVLAGCGRSTPDADFTVEPTGGPAPLTVLLTDTSGNGPTSWEWDFGDGGASTVQSPQHRYEAAGTYDVTLTVSKDERADSVTRPALISVIPGRLDRIEVAPRTPALAIGESHRLTAKAYDAFNNRIEAAQVTWAALAGGTIDDRGLFTAGTRAGTFQGAAEVRVSRAGVTISERLAITVLPDPLTAVVVTPNALQLRPGERAQLIAAAFDRYSNPLTPERLEWEATEEAGQVSPEGLFIAATSAGEYPRSVRVTATLGGASASATVDVTIISRTES